jgi:uncharacterized repeat protein (TIGR01451 family)
MNAHSLSHRCTIAGLSAVVVLLTVAPPVRPRGRGAYYPGTGDPQIYRETKLAASDAAANDFFGASVAISGDTAVVGADSDNFAGSRFGSAYVFVRSGSTWTQQAKLTASDASAGDRFGWSVGISGDTVVVGAYLDDDAGESSGSAYVFVRSGTGWTEQAKLTASDASAGDVFGLSVAISGDRVVVGAPEDNAAGTGSGSAYVFVRSGPSWAEQTKLTASDAAADDFFGTSVAISGDTVMVGAYLDDDAGSSSGSAYVYVRSGSTWTQQTKLTASDAEAGDEFGISVAIVGDTIVVGANESFGSSDPGSAYVYVRSGTSWTEQTKLTASDAAPFDVFGRSVAISDGTVVVGAIRDDDAGTDSGSAYVYLNVTEADLVVSLGADKTSVRSGDLLTYTVTARNLGPNGALNAVITDELSSGTKFVSASANRGAVTAPQPGQAGTVTWHPGFMLNGDEVTAQIQVRVISRGSTSITNTATVFSESSDPDPDNNGASLTTDVVRGGPR